MIETNKVPQRGSRDRCDGGLWRQLQRAPLPTTKTAQVACEAAFAQAVVPSLGCPRPQVQQQQWVPRSTHCRHPTLTSACRLCLRGSLLLPSWCAMATAIASSADGEKGRGAVGRWRAGVAEPLAGRQQAGRWHACAGNIPAVHPFVASASIRKCAHNACLGARWAASPFGR